MFLFCDNNELLSRHLKFCRLSHVLQWSVGPLLLDVLLHFLVSLVALLSLVLHGPSAAVDCNDVLLWIGCCCDGNSLYCSARCSLAICLELMFLNCRLLVDIRRFFVTVLFIYYLSLLLEIKKIPIILYSYGIQVLLMLDIASNSVRSN